MDLKLYAITDERFMGVENIVEKVMVAIEGGVTVVQYRAKKKEAREMYEEALKVREVTRKCRIPFIVNDRVDLALAVNADGVHVGQKDIPVSVIRKIVGGKFIIGLSTHNIVEAEKAQAENVNYIGFGPVYVTTTKEKPDPVVGAELLRKVTAFSRKPVVAIGGINTDNIGEVLACEPTGVAIVRGIFFGNPYKNAKKLREIIDATMG